MTLRVTAIMLSVQDLARSKKFYGEGVSELLAVLHAHAGLAIGFYLRLGYA